MTRPACLHGLEGASRAQGILEGIELEVDPNMVSTPRTNPYVRTDDWDEEAAKYMARKQAAA